LAGKTTKGGEENSPGAAPRRAGKGPRNKVFCDLETENRGNWKNSLARKEKRLKGGVEPKFYGDLGDTRIMSDFLLCLGKTSGDKDIFRVGA